MGIIVGKLNNTSQCYHWNIKEELDFCIGDYAIVENHNGFDLIEIVGELITTQTYLTNIVGSKVTKNVIEVISRKDITDTTI